METVNRNTISASKQRASLSIAAAAASALLAMSSPLFAADKSWSTAPTSNAFGGTNWSAGNVAGAATDIVNSDDALYFGASGTTALTNDLAGYNFAGVTFNTGAAIYTITGNAFTLTGNLVNNSTATQTFQTGITLAQNTTVTANTGALVLNGAINGGAFGLNKTGGGLLTLGAANAFTGGTTITGALNAGVTGALGTGAVAVNNGAGNQLQLGSGVNVSNAITLNGGGAVAQGAIYVPTGNATVSGTINITAGTNAGGFFATSGAPSTLTIAGDNTITSAVPVTVRLGKVLYAGAQSYTTGTTLANGGAAIQFGKIASMPATGTVALTTGTSAFVNAGGVGEFTDGSGTTTAGTIGGLLAGIGGQGAPVTLPVGTSVGIDTTNAAAAVTYTSPFTSANNVGLIKLGTGTLALSNGGTYSGAGGAGGFPLIARQGTLNLTGGTHTVNGEAVVGGTYGTANGAAGLDATLQIDNNATLAVTGFLSVGRGNGVGAVSSNLVVNNGTVTSSDFSLGYNANSGLNLPKASVTLNNASTFTVTGTNFLLAESAGSTGTLTLNNTAAVSTTSITGNVHLGYGGSATVVLNDASTFTAAGNNAQFYIGRSAGSKSSVTLNGTSKLIQSGAGANMVISDGGVGVLNNASPTSTVTSSALLIGHFGTGTGVVNNKGTLGGLVNGIFMGDGVGSSSYLRNDNGTAAVANGVAGNIVAGITTNSSAVVDVVSGTLSGLTVGGGFYQPGTTTNGQYNVSGGELHAGTFGFKVGDGVAGAKTVSVNVTGGTFSSTGPINLGVANNAASNGVLSVTTGGTVVADTITTAGTTAVSAVNFGGGTLKADPAGTSASLITANVGRVQLNAGGMTIDTNGVNKSVDALITNPTGAGVSQIALSGVGTGYVGRPLVKIIDSAGTGATAVANYNPVTGEVTGVTITSPGSNYVLPSVQIIGGGGTALTAVAVAESVAGGGLTKVGAGTLTLTAANTYTGTTTVKAGILKATAPAQTALLANTGSGVDLQTTGRLVLDYAGGSSPVAQVKTLLDAAYPGGFTTGQIRSTVRPNNTTLGYGDNGTNSVTVRITLAGDADLDGDVDFNDFLALQTNFGAAGTRFDQGNFNYDGATDFNDFLALQTNFGSSVAGGTVAVSLEQVAAMTAFAANPLNQAVPEPASLAVISLAAAGLLRRRRA